MVLIVSKIDWIFFHRHILGGYGLSTDVPVDHQTFDVVVAGEFLEHLYPADVDKTVKISRMPFPIIVGLR
jgi:hypothetical protein